MPSKHGSWIKLIPYGGADTVTGSCYGVETTIDGKVNLYLVDCGLFVGKSGRKINTNISHLAGKVDAIFVTHGHVDHVGRLPYLYRLGYRGPIYATRPARKMAMVRLPNSAQIQADECRQLFKKRGLKNKKIIKKLDIGPLYTQGDAVSVMNQFVDVKRGKPIRINDSLEVCFYNAGHELGSCSIMMTLTNGQETYRIYFSGDLGQNNVLIKRRMDSFKENVDFVVMESTYANRFHSKKKEGWRKFREAAADALEKGGNVVCPIFTTGRLQEMQYLYYKDMLENNDRIADIFRRTPVIIDSYMAVQTIGIFKEHTEEFKASAAALMRDKTNNPFCYKNLTLISEAEDSKKIIAQSSNYVVFAGAGMCNAGRVLYHLKKDLPNPNSVIIITGYQAEGTLGRQLINGDKQVKIHGETYFVRAKIISIDAFSGHVDQAGLLKWLEKIQKGYVLFLGHGEPKPQNELKEVISRTGMVTEDSIQPMTYGKIYHLYKGGFDATNISKANKASIDIKRKFSKNRKGISCIDGLLECIKSSLDEEFDLNTLQLIAMLEREVEEELIKCRRKKKENKPNKSRRGKK